MYLRRRRFGKTLFRLLLAAVVVIIALSALINGRNAVKRALYPVKYEEYVLKYSFENNLDPMLVYAIIKAESGFDPAATSHKDARGLMQIAVRTGEWAAEKLNIKDYTEEDLYDPEINIRIGCWYLGWLSKQFGSRRIILAAYNSGNGNVEQWLRDKKIDGSEESLDWIPFPETRHYVKRVEKNYEIYMELYKR